MITIVGYALLALVIYVAAKNPSATKLIVLPLSFGIPLGGLSWAFLAYHFREEMFSLQGYLACNVFFIFGIFLLTAISVIGDNSK